MILSAFAPYKNLGLLIIRLGLGVMFMLHGYPKLFGGYERWEFLGQQMQLIGINFIPTFWGFMASTSEFVGGLFFILGFLYKPTTLILTFTMIIASLYHISIGDGINGTSHPIEMAIVFIGLLFTGPGKYSLDKVIFK
ncbi:MAG: putative oxidoreductase [Flavobacteriales bacterium]|jgi:putative oxidoreductase